MRGFTAALLLLFVATAAGAHPVPADNRDRTVVIRLTPAGITVDYRLDIDLYSVSRELPEEETKHLESVKELYPVACRYLASVLANNIVVKLDGKDYPLRCTQRDFRNTDHLRLEYHFEADWVLPHEGTHRFYFRENNWYLDEVSKLAIHLTATDLTLTDVQVPSEELIKRPALDRRPTDMKKLRTASAILQWGPVEARGHYKPGLPPDPEPARGGPEDLPAASLASAPSRGERTGEHKPNLTDDKSPSEDVPGDTQAHYLLDLLLDTRLGLAMLLLLAALFGAAHALTPGHGKTLVAAYLIGERGTIGHAVLLGIVVTLTHTSAVLLLAILLPLCFPNANRVDVQRLLELLGGLLIAGLGIWLLLARVTGHADHIHIGGGHHHGPTPTANEPVGWRGLVLLGISGGLVPCWDAVLMLGFAVSAGRMWLGVPLLLAFSAGLAGVLVAIGIGVVSARGLLSRLVAKQSQALNLLGRGLPLASAVVVTALGLWLCYDVSVAFQLNR
jgi:ABC-type nickel/cobalt efflux system permease component RcnA